MQWRKSFDPSLTTTPEGRVRAFLASNLGLPRMNSAPNSSGFAHAWGQGGYLAPPTSGFAEPKSPVAAEELRVDPVGSLTCSLGRLDDCHEPVVLRATGL